MLNEEGGESGITLACSSSCVFQIESIRAFLWIARILVRIEIRSTSRAGSIVSSEALRTVLMAWLTRMTRCR